MACPSSWRATFILAIPGRLLPSSAPRPGRAGPPPPPQRRLPPPPPWPAPGAALPPGQAPPAPGWVGAGTGQGWSRAGGMEPRGVGPAARGPQAPGGGDECRRPGRGWSGDTGAQPRRTAPVRPARPHCQGHCRAHEMSSSPAPAPVSAPAPHLHPQRAAAAPTASPSDTGTRTGTRTGTGSTTQAHTPTGTGTRTHGPALGFSTRGGTSAPHSTGYWLRQRQRVVTVQSRGGTPCSGTRAHAPVHQHPHRWIHTCTLTPHLGYLKDGTPMSPSGPCHSTRTQGFTAVVLWERRGCALPHILP
ncbi:proline-rich protein 2-like [Pseudopipra pipra]|uniref:proline-rich protein 2-like n=1 Tax=Pseudopipra pipra TaxID=415032 RepID=UPI003138B31C